MAEMVRATLAQNDLIRNIWMLTREYGEIAGAGGVRDVVVQLAETLARWNGRFVSVVLPCYGFIDFSSMGFTPVIDPLSSGDILRFSVDMHQPGEYVSETVCFHYLRKNRVKIYLVDAKRYQQKNDVYTYTAEDEMRESWQCKSTGHYDYFAMNLLLQKAALDLMVCLGETPDIIHCHDGHTALAPALIRETPGYRRYFRQTGCLVTIHNAGYGYHQEISDLPYARTVTALPERLITENLLDLKFDPFLVAGQYAELNTVSENYADELQNSESDALTGWLGHELKARGITLSGITNGINPDLFSADHIYDDEEYHFLPASSEDELAGKMRGKLSLLQDIYDGENLPGVKSFGSLIQDESLPLFTFIGRLSEQKGVDLLTEVLGLWLKIETRVQVLILGSGSAELEAGLKRLATDEFVGNRFCYLQGFSPELASRIYAAGDFLVIPSRYEPCGLTDYIAQLFGNIPIVHHVGGLVKVIDEVTGIAYKGEAPGDLLGALKRALLLYDNTVRKREMQKKAVAQINEKHTWAKVMHDYLSLYKKAKIGCRTHKR